MHYRFAILDMCDECRLTLLKNQKISSNYLIHEMNRGKSNNCHVCGRVNAFTMGVLTDYRVDYSGDPAEALDEMKEKRSVDEGFAKLRMEDDIERKILKPTK